MMARAAGGQAEILRMNMAEGKNRLQRQCKKREVNTGSNMRANPIHQGLTYWRRANKWTSSR